MTEFALIMVSAILVNNFVLVQFLGLCPFMGVSKKIETAIGLSLATTFVLTLAAMCSYIVQQYVLKPLDLEFLRTISFILVIAVVVQFTEMVVNKTSPLLYRVLGIFFAVDHDQLHRAGRRAPKRQQIRVHLSDRYRKRLCRWPGFFAGIGVVCGHA